MNRRVLFILLLFINSYAWLVADCLVDFIVPLKTINLNGQDKIVVESHPIYLRDGFMFVFGKKVATK